MKSLDVHVVVTLGGWQCSAISLLGVGVGVSQRWHPAPVTYSRWRRPWTTGSSTTTGGPRPGARRAPVVDRQQRRQDATQDVVLLLPLLLLLAVPVQRVGRVSIMSYRTFVMRLLQIGHRCISIIT